jgi:hypothetical protein
MIVETKKTYSIQCADAKQAETLKLPVWFGGAAKGNARDGSKPNELLIDLEENQASSLPRDYGITPVPVQG